MNSTYKKKIVLIGEGAVGKTSLVSRFVHGIFSENYLSTIKAVTSTKKVQLENAVIDFDIWDIAGQTIHHPSLNLRHYSGAHGAIAVYDSSRLDTLVSNKINPSTNQEELFGIYRYLNDLFTITGKIPVVIVGNKYDLIRDFETYAQTSITDVKSGDKKSKNAFEVWMEMRNHRIIEYYETNYPTDAQYIEFKPVTEQEIGKHESILRKKLEMEKEMPYFISSAKTGENVENVFKTLAELIYEGMSV